MRGLKPGALARALTGARSPPSRLTPDQIAVSADVALLAALGEFVASGKPSAEIFTPEQAQELVTRGWAFEHDTPTPCIILTEAGWKAAGRAT